MHAHLERIHSYKGTPYEIGLACGKILGDKLERTIKHYIASRENALDMEQLHRGALTWLRSLPQRFQDEFAGMAEGAGLPLQLLAEWAFVEECEKKGCSGAVCLVNERVWVARNNDTYVPDLWGYATIRAVDGRIPTINFGLVGDVFTPTGINQERLWLHYNYLMTWDQPAGHKPHLPAYAFIVEALETCRSLAEVEARLNEIDRDGGMLLFAVDGKNNEVALFECLCSRHYRREPTNGWIVGTNHFCACADPTLGDDPGSHSTLSRYARLEELIRKLYAAPDTIQLPNDLIAILADDKIERRSNELVTAYSNVACPTTGEIWYTFGGYPSASQGNWQRLEWPW